VQLLDGDADAPRRIGQRVTRKHRAALRPVAAGEPQTCFAIAWVLRGGPSWIRQGNTASAGSRPMTPHGGAEISSSGTREWEWATQVAAVCLAVHRMLHASVLRHYGQTSFRRHPRGDCRYLIVRPHSGRRRAVGASIQAAAGW
jgi:hypothetical protein